MYIAYGDHAGGDVTVVIDGGHDVVAEYRALHVQRQAEASGTIGDSGYNWCNCEGILMSKV